MVEKLTGGQALARAILRMGTERIYGIAGTSNVAFLDALYEVRDRLRYVSCRHEQVAASMADAEGRLTGRPGVVLVHSGPGALNAMISAGNALKDSSPMIIVSGAVKRRLKHSDGMLELEHTRVFAPVCKETLRVESAPEVPATFSEAYRVCMSASRGPVLIEVPEDVWQEQADIDIDSMMLEADVPTPVNPADVAMAIEMLSTARLPLILSGGGVAYSHSGDLLVRLAEELQVPVITTGNGRGTIPETHPLSFGRVGFGGGNLIADKALERCDALVCLGAGISDMTTYEFTAPVGAQRIMIVNISAGSIAPQAPKGVVVFCDVADFLGQAVEQAEGRAGGSMESWNEAIAGARATWQSMARASIDRESARPSAAKVISSLAAMVPGDTIVSVGAGMHLLYPMTFMPCNHPLSFLSTVNFGSMGFGMAAAMAARMAYPDRTAIAFLGDGDFMMTIQDLETAVRECIGMKVFVINDYQYRVLNFRQRLQFAGRICGTEHGNPDFADVARCFGAAGYRLDEPGKIDEILAAAVAVEGPVVVDVIIDPEDLPPMNLEANLRMSAG